MFLLGGSFLGRLHDLFSDDHPGASWWAGTVVESTLTAGQVRLALAGDFGDQAFRQRGEETGVPPDLQTPAGGRSVSNSPGNLTPLRVCSEPPHRTLELIPQPLGAGAVLAYRQERRHQPPLFVGELPPRHGRLPAGSA